ncbi:MAG: ATP-dependent Clp protease proteolytic subunit [Clostridium sp.]|nr:ATP-dependent Clp protease proteolytic subunit [Clostridium sp.]MCM1444179.1 ATP-dependent Clp protease proteolytic subunit [Candidatus Amulumruptor caecigallinarius]
MEENKNKAKSNAKTKKKKKKETKPKTPSDINLFDNRIIRLNKTIDKEVAEEITEQLLKLDATKSKKDIIFYINSPGGTVSDGIAIYDTMQMVKSDVVTICLGRCASMAALLLSGGTKGKRYITPNSEVMIHEVSSCSYGKVGEIKVDFEHTNTLNERIIKILADNTGKSIEQVRQDIQLKDKWFNADEGIEYGLIDKILIKNQV